MKNAGKLRASLPVRRASRRVRMLKGLVNLARRVEKWRSGAYAQKFPLDYSLYVDDLSHRNQKTADAGSYAWPSLKEN